MPQWRLWHANRVGKIDLIQI